MDLHVVELRDPDQAHARALEFLVAEPAMHNILLTVLGQRRDLAVSGRFWVASDGNRVVGFAVQSPLDRHVLLARMDDDVIRTLADAIDAPIPGVIGIASCAATFAGHFATRHRVAVAAVEAQRLYELTGLVAGAPSPGAARTARADDRPTLADWSREFAAETDTPDGPAPELMDRLIAGGQWWVWENGELVSMVRFSDAVAGVARVQHVYTPIEHRGAGYATACVEHVSRLLTERGLRCVLYTALANPTSNAIYRRLGYAPIAEVLRYDFA